MRDLIYRILADASDATAKNAQVEKGLQDITGAANTMGKGLGGATASFAGMAAAAGAITTVVGAAAWSILNASKSTGEWGSRITDMSLRMGMSKTAIQQLDSVAVHHGETLESVAQATALLSKHITSGDAGALSAFHRLGLSIRDLRAMSPEQLFVTVGDAIGKMTNPTERQATAQALLGRSGAALIPMFGDIREEMGQAVVISDQAVKRANDLDTAWKDISEGSGTAFHSLLSRLAGPLQVVGDLLKGASQRMNDYQDAQDRVTASGKSTSDAGAMKAALFAIELERAADKAQKAVKGLITNGLEPVTMSMEEADRIAKKLTSTAEKQIKTTEKWTKEWQNLAQIGEDAEATIDSLDGSVAEGIKWYLQRGASVSDLATAYGVFESQVKAVAAALDLEKRAMEARQAIAKSEIEDAKKTNAVWDEVYAMRVERTGSTLDAELHAIDARMRADVAGIEVAGEAWQQHYDAIAALARERTDAVLVDWDKLKEGSRKSLEDTALVAENVFAKAMADSGSYTMDRLAQLEREALAARSAAQAWGQEIQTSGLLITGTVTATTDHFVAQQGVVEDSAKAGADAWFRAYDDAGKKVYGIVSGGNGKLGGGTVPQWSAEGKSEQEKANKVWEMTRAFEEGRYYGPTDSFGRPDMAAYGLGGVTGSPSDRGSGGGYLSGIMENAFSKPLQPAWGIQAPGRASGGPIRAGQPYMVGERGQELVIPDTNGTVVPNHALGGMSVTVNVDAREGTWTSPAAQQRLADKVGSAVLAQLRLRGATV